MLAVLFFGMTHARIKFERFTAENSYPAWPYDFLKREIYVDT